MKIDNNTIDRNLDKFRKEVGKKLPRSGWADRVDQMMAVTISKRTADLKELDEATLDGMLEAAKRNIKIDSVLERSNKLDGDLLENSAKTIKETFGRLAQLQQGFETQRTRFVEEERAKREESRKQAGNPIKAIVEQGKKGKGKRDNGRDNDRNAGRY